MKRIIPIGLVDSYKDLYTKYDLEDDCFKNNFFDHMSDMEEMYYYAKLTNELTSSCSDGYYPCA